MAKEFRQISTSGILGYGFPEESLKTALERGADSLGVDGGSTDGGPYYLGSGTAFCSNLAIRRDLRLMLLGARAYKIPLIIATCGGAGGEPHLQLVVNLAREIAREENLHFKMAVIHAEQSKEFVKEKIAQNRIIPFGRRPALDPATVDKAERIVGMMGPEPIMRALDEGAEVIFAGRSTDPAPFAAASTRAGMPSAPSWYAGKMLECGASCSLPKGHDCIMVTVREDGVDIEPANPIRRCTPTGIANFSLHENASPVRFTEPGGTLDTSDCTFDALSDRAVRVKGMRWEKAEKYTIKLEAAEKVGYRAICVAGTRDPKLIARVDAFLEDVRGEVAYKVQAFGVKPEDYNLCIRTYGHNGVMAEREFVKEIRGHELGFLIDVVAPSQETASAVLAVARANMLHTDFPGRLCREGNMAFPLSPSDVPVGAAYRFSIAHLVVPDDPYCMFPIEYENV
ncbi:DUF1446 domain-containing protein [Desulfovibrio sp. OttesenSCG-928-O18]|nr:DUF1446 domain-containing protein [Desulfovibrio sp. OttesenSCG-928-O18]